MLHERRNLILQELDEVGYVKVNELSKKLKCSEVTIRNDIKEMEEQGLLERTHGGATKVGIQFTKRYTGETIYRNVDKKMIIAKKAYELIEDNDTIIIDDASTSLYLTQFIKEGTSKHIVVMTNSLLVAMELADVKHVDLFLVGGQVAGTLAATMGELTINHMSEFFVDKAFIGVHGINFNVGITSIGTLQMQVKRAIIKSAKEVYVLADSSKFGGSYLSVICPLDKVTKVITDNEITEEYIHIANEQNIDLVIVQ